MDKYLNVKFSLRKLLTNPQYHTSTSSIPSEEVQNDFIKIYPTITFIAQQIEQNPNLILYDTYDPHELANDWLSLLSKPVLQNNQIIKLDVRSRPGHKILDHYMHHFYDVKNYKGISVRSSCTQPQLEKALLANISMHSTPYKSEIRRMICFTAGLSNVTKYRTVTSKAIAQYYSATRILDPCTGWGGRMLGALASSDQCIYVGYEPDTNTFQGLMNILKDNAIPFSVRTRATIFNLPVQTDFIQQLQKFDMILTSPPYFNLELYTSGEQSIQRHTTWDEWVEQWLKRVILGCLQCLTEHGTSCWSVKNFKSDKYYPLADVTKKIHEEAGWTLVNVITMTGSARPMNQKTKCSEEETLCFKKI